MTFRNVTAQVCLLVAILTTATSTTCWSAAQRDEFYKLVPPEGEQFRNPGGLTVIRDRLYFVAAHDDHGPAIWSTDGTSEGTTRITPYATFTEEQRKKYEMIKKVIERDPSHNQFLEEQLADERRNMNRPHTVRGVGTSGLFYFISSSHETRSLWYVDENDGMPVEVQQFSSSAGKSVLAWRGPVVGGRLLFLCSTPDHGRELWSSDGTPTGTGLVRDLVPGPKDAFPVRGLKSPWAIFGDGLYFSAPDAGGVPSLWRSDGTDAGTRLIARLADDGEQAARLAEGFTVHGDQLLLFRGGLWVSDGTKEGTRRIRRGLSPTSIVSCDDYVYFVASAPDEERKQLWRTDGTAEGTVKVPSSNPAQVLGQSGSSVLFQEDLFVYATDGDPANTGLVQNLLPYDVACWGIRLFNDRLFILADDYERPLEHSLYVSQTTDRGARCLKRNVISQFFEYVGEPVALDSCVFFLLPDMAPGAIWVYRHDEDASPPEWPRDVTAMVADTPAATAEPGLAKPEQEGAKSDDLTVIRKEGYSVFDLYPGHLDSYPGEFVEAGGRVFFRARTRDNRQVLWTTDGTPEGTREAGRPNPYPWDDMRGHVAIQDITPLGDGVVFTANDGEHGAELWRSDGTPEGTTLVGDLTPGTEGTFTRTGQGSPEYFARCGDRLFFWQATGTDNYTLWRTDGTPDGTKSVKSFSTVDPHRCSWLVEGDRLFFETGPGNHVSQLWVTDGTADGTTLVAEYKGGLELMAALHGRVYYTAGFYKLHSTDGTAEGVTEHDEKFDAGEAVTVGDTILFFATRPSDEKSGGVYALRDDPFSVEMVWPDGSRYQGPDAFLPAGRRLVFKFSYYDAFHVCDGTRSGTRPLWEGDLFENAFLQNTRPCNLGDDVYFTANGELWRIPADKDEAERCLRPQVEGVGRDPDVGVPDFVFNSIAAVGDYLITSGSEPEYGEEVYVIDRR